MNHAFIVALQKIYPAERLLTRDVELLPYESDALTAFQTKPGAAVLPVSEDEVIATVRLCHEMAVPFVARGSGTSLSGGSLPIADGIIIGLNRMNRILKIDPQQRIADRRTWGHQSPHHRGRPAVRPVLRARSLQPVDLHHRR